jgi:hypothetical protein
MPLTFTAAMLAPAILLTACADQKPQQLQGVSGPAMSEQDIGGRPTLAYLAPGADLRKYKRFILDTVTVYRGSDAQFGDATDADKQQLAQYMHSTFANALGSRYSIVTKPGPDVARIHLTLGGLEDSTPVVSTASHVLPVGLVTNLVNEQSGKPASFSASVTIAGEIRDSQTNKLEVSFIQKRFPDAMDISDSMVARDGQKAAIKDTADTFRARVDKIQAGGSATE